MNEEIAIKICEQMKDDIDNLCDCCRKNEKNRTCIGCRELAIETILKENARLKDKINMAIEYYEANQQECVIGRNKDDKLIKEYYLPAQCSKKLLDILKEN